MPTLPMPLGGAALSGGDLPVSDGNDVLEEFSVVHKRPEVAPVRDDFCAAFAKSHLAYQDLAAYALAQTDPLRATGHYLRQIALEHGVIPAPGESDASIRARLFRAPKIVTPQAIVDVLNDLLSNYTEKQVELVELELDGLYVHNGEVTAWDGGFIGAQPRYPDRYYAEDKDENDGFFLTNNSPRDTLVSMGIPRCFHLLIPDLAVANEDFAFTIDADDEIMAIGDGSDLNGAESDGSVSTEVFGERLTEYELYDAIVGLVDSIKGQGVVWSALVKSDL